MNSPHSPAVGDDAIARLRRDLFELYLNAGCPSLRKIADRDRRANEHAAVSHTTIGRMINFARDDGPLPSLLALRSTVRGLGGDTAPFEALWREARRGGSLMPPLVANTHDMDSAGDSDLVADADRTRFADLSGEDQPKPDMSVGGVDGFVRQLEAAIGGSVATSFPDVPRPDEIYLVLRQQLAARAVQDLGDGPHRFTVLVAPEDHRRYEPYLADLLRELSSALAHERSWASNEVVVEIQPYPTTDPGYFSVDVDGSASAAPALRPAPVPTVASPAAPLAAPVPPPARPTDPLPTAGAASTSVRPGPPGSVVLKLSGYSNPTLIANGSTALVFRATQQRLNRTVAVKVLLVDNMMTTEATFARELEMTVALSNQPHIVSIIDTGVTDAGQPYIVMEYCEGGSYAQILKQRGPLPVPEVVDVGTKIGEALHAAHQMGIIHRDVKPPNILRSRFGPALTDFGIARAPDDLGSTVTVEKMTPHHASPEALLLEAQSGQSDVYSLASTLWNLLAGYPPFVEPGRQITDALSFRDRVLREPVPAVPRADVPAWLQQELATAMAKRPEHRHPSAQAFADSLRWHSYSASMTASAGATASPARWSYGPGQLDPAYIEDTDVEPDDQQTFAINAGAPADITGQTSAPPIDPFAR